MCVCSRAPKPATPAETCDAAAQHRGTACPNAARPADSDMSRLGHEPEWPPAGPRAQGRRVDAPPGPGPGVEKWSKMSPPEQGSRVGAYEALLTHACPRSNQATPARARARAIQPMSESAHVQVISCPSQLMSESAHVRVSQCRSQPISESSGPPCQEGSAVRRRRGPARASGAGPPQPVRPLAESAHFNGGWPPSPVRAVLVGL